MKVNGPIDKEVNQQQLLLQCEPGLLEHPVLQERAQARRARHRRRRWLAAAGH